MRNCWWCRGCAAMLGCAIVLGCAVPALRAKTVMQRKVELTPWEQAERGLEMLEGISAGARTRADYTRAMDGFRAVYHDAPGDAHAPDSVNAVAELLAEQGRSLHDAKSLKAAVGQYEFLRMQYPASSLRVGALLAEAQIYQNDLHDAAAAKERYALLVKQYPRSAQAEEAKAGIASLKAGSSEEGVGSRGRIGRASDLNDASASAGAAVSVSAGLREKTPVEGSGASSFAPMPTTGEARGVKGAPVGASVDGAETGRGGTSVPVDAALDASSAGVQEGPVQDASVQAAAVRNAGPLHVAKGSGKRHGQMAQVTGIRHWSTPDYTRVAIDLGDDVTYEAARVPNPDRIYFDLHGTRLAQELVGKSFAVTDDGFLKKIRAAQFSNDMTRVVLDVNDVTEYSAFLLPNPYRLIIDIHGGSKAEPGAPVVSVPMQRVAAAAPTVPNTTAVKAGSSFDVAALSAQPGRVEATTQPTSQPISAVVPRAGSRDEGVGSSKLAGTDIPATPATNSTSSSSARKGRKGKVAVDVDALPARAAVPTADGETSLVRALGLKIGRIVIDPGHGGHDSGTLGADGIEEKDVVLDVALRLGKLLHDRLGSEIIYTRSDDTFVPLETRTAIANKAQADLFLSIHANSSPDASARGVETYYLNFTSSPDALETAARENAVSDQSIHQLSDLVKKIALKDKIEESREFAGDVQQGLYGGLQKGNAGLKDRGVKKAPFVVLIGANMPSILAEISFVTNEKDARQLQEPEYRERVAESLYKGVAKYAGGLSGTRPPAERASTK
ncbi:MAG: cell wall hydrolase/autolysin [Edaphobacter sp.]|nr:cell wall hydrolase/autolysin [Edaphobacter sp.]